MKTNFHNKNFALSPTFIKRFKATWKWSITCTLVLVLRCSIGNRSLCHAIENTANQKARNPLHILRYATGVFHEKIPAFLAAYKFFPPKDRLKSLRQVKIFIQKKLPSTPTKKRKNTPVLTLILNSSNQTSNRKVNSMSGMG